jgi:diguanylate cyclase (GGDEF)-like protein
LGGDEFVVMLTDSDNEKCDEILNRFAAAIAETNAAMNKLYKIEYSVGLAHFQYDTNKSAEDMIQVTDAAMYKHKKKQKNKAEE